MKKDIFKQIERIEKTLKVLKELHQDEWNAYGDTSPEEFSKTQSLIDELQRQNIEDELPSDIFKDNQRIIALLQFDKEVA